ncbi:hypothetical protein BDV38DRAFT_288513 [Aspergillus pseudotamarii]|uniref:Uncharacterized protein n=1 Tax=Aspergillus pseudotamarii TaxID=132259 RepID=A0A5N6SD91_ASPPS|nr:uncharacterized protein BDV38DRAFT_288513 [Aspergillus pseudotamarii]KAE8131641.1 hypothetical protein BDV38DRAFT_288513 [Aspergillus pseudotamarii]
MNDNSINIEKKEPVQEPVQEPLDENYFSIQVSAKHLILASPVFKKILTGGWKESVTYLQKGTVEITAEGWDLEALLILLRAIHGQQYQVPRKLTLAMLANVAVLADYYDCKEAVYIWSTIWIDALEEKIPKTYSEDLFRWLWVSWAFQLPDQFKESTSTVMSWGDRWINGLGFPIPVRVMEAMNKFREEAINNLVTLLYDRREALLSGTRGCCFECSSIMYGALTKEMRSVDLLLPRPKAPFPGLNHKALVQKIQSFTVPQWTLPSSGYRTYCHSCANSSFETLLGTLNDLIQGLDLHSLIP